MQEFWDNSVQYQNPHATKDHLRMYEQWNMELCLQVPLVEIGRVLELNDSHGNMRMGVLSIFINVGFHALASGERTCCSVRTARHVEGVVGQSVVSVHWGQSVSFCVSIAPVLHLC